MDGRRLRVDRGNAVDAEYSRPQSAEGSRSLMLHLDREGARPPVPGFSGNWRRDQFRAPGADEFVRVRGLSLNRRVGLQRPWWLSGLEGCGQRGHDLEQIPHDTVVGDFKDRRVGILVDRDDRARPFHADEMLNRSRDAQREIEFRRDSNG